MGQNQKTNWQIGKCFNSHESVIKSNCYYHTHAVNLPFDWPVTVLSILLEVLTCKRMFCILGCLKSWRLQLRNPLFEEIKDKFGDEMMTRQEFPSIIFHCMQLALEFSCSCYYRCCYHYCCYPLHNHHHVNDHYRSNI